MESFVGGIQKEFKFGQSQLNKKNKSMNEDIQIALVGLGYVGLPLAVEFGKKYKTFGFDLKEARIEELNRGYDHTLEVEEDRLKSVLTDASGTVGLYCTNELEKIQDCNYYIVTVPTPVDKNNRPDLTPLYKASETIGKVLSKGDIVIYESTEYTGSSEEEGSAGVAG